MANLATVLKEEIRRLARKEVNSGTDKLQRQSAVHRRDIAELKRQVADLQRRVTYLEKREKSRLESKPDADSADRVRFSPTWLKKHREKLGISAEAYAKLVGVSALTIYNWESGKTRPRQAQLAALSTVRGIGKREAQRRLEVLEG